MRPILGRRILGRRILVRHGLGRHGLGRHGLGRSRRRGVLLAAFVVAAAGCNSVHTLSYAPSPVPPPGPSTTVPATLPDGAGVSLPPVAGRPTTTVPAIVGGTATISGTVLGPQGAIAGATVLAERIVGGASVSISAVTGPDGSFSIGDLLGGDYRVRAWEPPTLTMAAPTIFFLSDAAVESLSLSLTLLSTPGVAAAIDPDPPVAGQPANLAVLVTMPTVGTDGLVRSVPLSGAMVTLANGPDWDLDGDPNPLTTGPNGEAVFEVTCTQPGDQPLDAAVNGQPPVALQVPGCAPPPTTTTTSTTTTTVAGGTGTATTGSTSSTSTP